MFYVALASSKALFFMDVEKKAAKEPNSTPKGTPCACQGPLGSMPVPPNVAKNWVILIL